MAEASLCQAAREGDVARVRTLLEERVHPDTTDDRWPGYTALMLAGEENHAEIVELLLEYGARFDVRTEREMTALTVATCRGSTAAVEAMLRGARPQLEAELSYELADGSCALGIAAYQDQPDIVRLLLAAGADVNFKTASRRVPRCGENGMSTNGGSALHKATAACIPLLLEARADINSLDWSRRTALMRCCRLGRDEGVAELLRAGADVTLRDEDGRTALHYAAEQCSTVMIRALVEAGADLFAEDRAHATPFRIVDSLPQVRLEHRPLEEGVAYIEIPEELWIYGERAGQQECRELLKELMDSALMTKSAR